MINPQLPCNYQIICHINGVTAVLVFKTADVSGCAICSFPESLYYEYTVGGLCYSTRRKNKLTHRVASL